MQDWIEKINSSESLEQLEQLRVDILGKKGVLTLEFAKMKSVPNEEKKAFAQNLNTQKAQINEVLESHKTVLMAKELEIQLESEKNVQITASIASTPKEEKSKKFDLFGTTDIPKKLVTNICMS